MTTPAPQLHIPVWVAKGPLNPILAVVDPDSPLVSDGGPLVLRHVPGTVNYSLPVDRSAALRTSETHITALSQQGQVVGVAVLIPAASLDISQVTACSVADATLTIPASAVIAPGTVTVPGAWHLAQGTLTVPAAAAPPASGGAVQVKTQIVAGYNSTGSMIAAAMPLTPLHPAAIANWNYYTDAGFTVS